MSQGTYLFIGGSHDGRRMEAPGEPIVQLPEFREPPRFFSEKMEHVSNRPRVLETYRLEILRYGKHDVVGYYVLDSMLPESALLLLVVKYKGRHQ